MSTHAHCCTKHHWLLEYVIVTDMLSITKISCLYKLVKFFINFLSS